MGAQVFSTQDIRNIVLVGHGFSGKTSLAEAMLFNSGVTTRLGATENGTSTFDFEPEEEKRGGSIASAFAWLEYDGKKVNIIDTPGDGNFIYDAYAAMRGADAAVVVVSCPDGVEVQTERVWNQALLGNQPRVIYINKMDRARANVATCLKEIEASFGVTPLPVQVPIGTEGEFKGVIDLFSRKAYTWRADGSGTVTEGDVPSELSGEVDAAWETLVETVAATDDDLLEKYLETFELTEEETITAFKAAMLTGEVVPVLFGAAASNIGVQPLVHLVARACPNPLEGAEITSRDGSDSRKRAENGAFTAQVIRTFVDEFSGKITVFRVLSGQVPADGQVANSTHAHVERLGALHAQIGKDRTALGKGVCGDIIAVAKLKATHTNDTLVGAKDAFVLPGVAYPPPMISFVIVPAGKGDEDKIKTAVERLIEEDPTLSLAYDELSHQMVLNGMGQAHLELSIEKMARKFKVAVATSLPSVPYRETLARAVRGVEGKHKKQTGGSGQFGVCFLDVEPLEPGSGFEFVNKVFGGAIPRQYISSVEKGVRDRMHHGDAAGYPVVDIRVTVVDGKYHAVDSKDLAYQLAGSKGLKLAMQKSGMNLLEPFYAMTIAVPQDNVGDIMGDVTSRRGRVLGMEPKGKNTIINAQCPLAEIQRYAPDLHSMTGGKGSFMMAFDHYAVVPSHLVDKIRLGSPFTDMVTEEV
jgi:elongation factor G